MRILLVHNFYLQRGGEDVVFRDETKLLQENHHAVVTYIDDNNRIGDVGRASVALQSIWSWESYGKLRTIIKNTHPDIVHFHNTFPMISPSVYYACSEMDVPTVQTLHNFRLICPVAILYRQNAICEKCIGRNFPWPGILHKCYHNSMIQTGVVAASNLTHNLLRTWHRKIDAFISLTEFSKEKFLQAGFSKEKIYVKPNFVRDRSSAEIPLRAKDDFVLYVGRLVQEKGITTMCRAWNSIKTPLLVFGEGFLPPIQENNQIYKMDFADRDTIFTYMKRARALILPSEWYEGFPVVIAEAFANSLPVITSNIGSQAEIVRDGYSGLHFRAGDPADLATKVEWLLAHPEDQLRMSQNARKEYEEKYTPERNYGLLMDIYTHAVENHENQRK